MSRAVHCVLHRSTLVAATTLLILLGATAASATDIYVSTTGTNPVVGCEPNLSGATPYLTIQKAVDCASPGDVIHVAAGTYEEQVVITINDLTIQGAGIGSTVIKSPMTLTASFITGTSTTNKPVVFVNGATNVTIQDLTVDGFGRGNLNVRFSGIAYWNSGGKLMHVSVVGVRDTPFSGAQHGVGVYAYNNTAGPYALEVANVTVTDFQKNAMALNANGNLTVNVHDCTTTGAGPTGVTAQNGIQFSGSSGTVTDCTISDVDYTGSGWTASGLLLFGPGTVTTSGTNPIMNCQAAVYSQDLDADFGGVDVSGTTTWGAIFYNTTTFKANGGTTPETGRPVAAPFDAGIVSKAILPRVQASYTVSMHDGCLAGTDAGGTSGVYAWSGGGPFSVSLTRLEITDWDYGVIADGAACAVVANDNAIVSNVSAGFDNTLSLAAQDAEWNWWGDPSGPGGDGPGTGDAVFGANVDFISWRSSGADLLPGCGFLPPTDTVGPGSASGCISALDSCVTVPVSISRESTDNMRGFSVTLTLSSELELCGGLGSITEGTYLSGIGGTNFQALDNGGGSYTVDCAILGIPCGATAATGNLFNLSVKASGGDGSGTITVTGVTLRNCSNGAIAGEPGSPATITIDTVGPDAVTDLAAAQVKTSNDGDGTTKITLTFGAPGDAATVEVYRAGFGQYPEYDDNGGVVPATPSYPPGGPWVLTGVTATGQTDEVATRDFWYYVVFTKDACGNVSAVSNKTSGTLNYHLGDVTNGVTACQGNNLVNTLDISLLGAHYGITLGPPVDTWACLDVGPTTDYSIDGRPTTDNRVQFEDLILFAINYGQVSKQRLDATPAQTDEIVVLVPESADANALLDVHLWARGTGRVQGLSARLEWDPAIVVPVGVEPGDLVRALDGVAFTPEPGVVDVALLGVRSLGLAGEGDLATVRFRVIGAGDPGIALATIDARDASNRKVEMNAGAQANPTAAVPRVTALLANVPNPFNPTTRIPYPLASGGTVDLAVYTVDGRRVRALFTGEREPGLYDATWDGTDERGDRVSSGVYYVRLATRDLARSRPIVLLK